MDDSKEYNTNDLNSDDVESVATDTLTENTEDSENTAVEHGIDYSVFEDSGEDYDSEDASKAEQMLADEEISKPKKKRFVQTTVLISFVIVLVVALGFAVAKCFFDTSISGTWAIVEDTATDDEASTSDEGEAKTYYIFDDDGTATVAFGTIEYVGTYTTETDEDGNNTVTLDISSAGISSSFDYAVEGNLFTGRKLTFTTTYYDTEYEYTFNSASRVIPELKVDDDFEPNDEIIGEWNYNDGVYDFTYEFNADGTVVNNQLDMLFISGVYNYTDDTITITYYTNEEAEMELAYTLDGDTITLNGVSFTKVDPASADES